MLLSGTPALSQVGIAELLFGTVWKPTAADPSYGILYVILTSIVGTALAILVGVPIGVFTAIFLAEVASRRVAALVRPAIELLAGIPSVIYGLLGIMVASLPNWPTKAGATQAMTLSPLRIAWISWKIWLLSAMAAKGQFTRHIPQETHLS